MHPEFRLIFYIAVLVLHPNHDRYMIHLEQYSSSYHHALTYLKVPVKKIILMHYNMFVETINDSILYGYIIFNLLTKKKLVDA